MINIWHDIAQSRIQKNAFVACVSSPAGTQTIQRLDLESGFLMLDHNLDDSMRVPYNLTLIPRTCDEDKQPLECLVLSQYPVPALTLLQCATVGLLRLTLKDQTTRGIILAVSRQDDMWGGALTIDEIPAAVRKSIVRFFKNEQLLLKNPVASMDFAALEDAEKWIEAGSSRYRTQFCTKRPRVPTLTAKD